MALLNSFTSGVSAVKTFGKSLEVIGDNIANVNTTGFKGSRTTNQDNFSQTFERSSAGADTASPTFAMQVGSGTSVASISQKFIQGVLSTTGGPADLGIAGNGFFQVKNPSNSETFVTRAGDFRIDNLGYFVTPQGFRLQGNNVDIKLATPPTGSQLESYSISSTGVLREYYSDGTSTKDDVAQKIYLKNFTNPNALMKTGMNLFTGMADAGPIEAAQAGTAGLGLLKQGTLELSNVDLTQEFADLILAQRAFQAGSRVITVSDSVMEEIVNLKR
jgi:flagellar hook protein FlgE